MLRWLLHDVLAWLRPASGRGFDGCSPTAICRDCGRQMLADSQGNWFHAQ